VSLPAGGQPANAFASTREIGLKGGAIADSQKDFL
jgi:hypothetical protein